MPSPVQLIASNWVSHVEIYQLGTGAARLMWRARNKHVWVPEPERISGLLDYRLAYTIGKRVSKKCLISNTVFKLFHFLKQQVVDCLTKRESSLKLFNFMKSTAINKLMSYWLVSLVSHAVLKTVPFANRRLIFLFTFHSKCLWYFQL